MRHLLLLTITLLMTPLSSSCGYGLCLPGADCNIPPTEVIIFTTNNNYDGGQVGNRDQSTGNCYGSNSLDLDHYFTTVALLSYSGGDSIADLAKNYGMPTDLPFRSTSGTTIADNFTDLLDGSIDVSISAAGVTAANYWSGSQSNGTLAANNCSDWSTTAGSGQFGLSTSTTSTTKTKV